MDIKEEITPEPFKAYQVTRNSDGACEICTLTRGVWNDENGGFFAYENGVHVEGEVLECSQCGMWEIFTIGDRCQQCAHFDFHMEV